MKNITFSGNGKSISDMVFQKYKIPLRNGFISYPQLELLKQAHVYPNIINKIFINTAVTIAKRIIANMDMHHTSHIYQDLQQFTAVDKRIIANIGTDHISHVYQDMQQFNAVSKKIIDIKKSLSFNTFRMKARPINILKAERTALIGQIGDRAGNRSFEGPYNVKKGMDIGYQKPVDKLLPGNELSDKNETGSHNNVPDSLDLSRYRELKPLYGNYNSILINKIMKSHEFITNRYSVRDLRMELNPASTGGSLQENGRVHTSQGIVQNSPVKWSLVKVNRFIQTDEQDYSVKRTAYSDNLTYKETKIEYSGQSGTDTVVQNNQSYRTGMVQLSNKTPDNTGIPPVIDIGSIVDRVYSELERKIRFEKERIGL